MEVLCCCDTGYTAKYTEHPFLLPPFVPNCIINCIFYSPFTTPILLHSQRYTPVYCRFCSAHSAPFYCSSTMCLEIKFYFNLRLACWILASRLASVSTMSTWDPWDQWGREPLARRAMEGAVDCPLGRALLTHQV